MWVVKVVLLHILQIPGVSKALLQREGLKKTANHPLLVDREGRSLKVKVMKKITFWVKYNEPISLVKLE